jgi:hypothetical protein
MGASVGEVAQRAFDDVAAEVAEAIADNCEQEEIDQSSLGQNGHRIEGFISRDANPRPRVQMLDINMYQQRDSAEPGFIRMYNGCRRRRARRSIRRIR